MTEKQIDKARAYNRRRLTSTTVRRVERLLGLEAKGEPDYLFVQRVSRWQLVNGLVADGMVGPNTLRAMFPPLPVGSLRDILRAAVNEAEIDWIAGTSEEDIEDGGGLDSIFDDAAWSPDVDLKRNRRGKLVPKDWCGMSVGAWLHRCGLLAEYRKAHWATGNVRAHYSYGAEGPTNRYIDVHEEHKAAGLERRYLDAGEVSAALAAGTLDVWPGEVVLIGRRKDGRFRAQHIAMVHSWDGRTLATIEGNASGLGPDGIKRREAVVVNHRDLSDARQRARIYALCRPSILDFSE